MQNTLSLSRLRETTRWKWLGNRTTTVIRGLLIRGHDKGNIPSNMEGIEEIEVASRLGWNAIHEDLVNVGSCSLRNRLVEAAGIEPLHGYRGRYSELWVVNGILREEGADNQELRRWRHYSRWDLEGWSKIYPYLDKDQEDGISRKSPLRIDRHFQGGHQVLKKSNKVEKLTENETNIPMPKFWYRTCLTRSTDLVGWFA